jgi:hypothetical protein
MMCTPQQFNLKKGRLISVQFQYTKSLLPKDRAEGRLMGPSQTASHKKFWKQTGSTADAICYEKSVEAG